MVSNFKPIGSFIRRVDKRNRDLSVTDLRGLSMTKEFRKTTSNIIGTDMSNYKVVNKNQFACDFMSVIRVYKLPVVLHAEEEPIIVSPAYPVFEVKDEKVLLPEYLMMWMRRSEFDRYAFFRCDSAIRGGFGWDELCEVEIPIPDIEIQKEIVKEYNIIINRIKLNSQLIQKLEETAQTIFKEWFEDFEFPDEKGNSYKSSGGEMEYNEELDRDIPKSWLVEKIGGYVNLSQGLCVNATTAHLIKNEGLPLLRITDLIHNTKKIFIDKSVPKKNIATKDDIIITRTGQVGLVFKNKEGVVYNNCFKIAPKNSLLEENYLYWFLKRKNTFEKMIELAEGSSAQLDLTHGAFSTLIITIPNKNIQITFSNLIKHIDSYIDIIKNEIWKLEDFKQILLSKMS
ncbi:MAG: restriction endonuclease subunit S [Candidatus ainarchaeum sp.]|nr:restriction endonuclease subunit S [Candidatus ainarchaeum sp.]MDD3975902.1 restriction endonuclease subunit S [Candidatus ainarchaeum sp.]